MPVPTFTGMGPNPSFEDVTRKINTLVMELRNLMLSLDTLNVVELNAEVIIANTITANKMNVTELSAITANLGTITAGTVTGALIQNQTAEGNRVYIDSQGFHSKDSSGVERITIGTTPAKGAKALITRNAAGVEQGVYTYDTETVDGAIRVGQYITTHGCYLLFASDGSVRIQDAGQGGIRFPNTGARPQISAVSNSWFDIAYKTEADARGKTLDYNSVTKDLTMKDANGNTLSTVNLT